MFWHFPLRCFVLLAISLPCLSVAADEAATKPVSFQQDIYPLLVARCFECHAGLDASSGYRLDHRPELLGETNGTPLVKPGHAGQSLLIDRVNNDDPDERMPPEGEPLASSEIELLRRWIDQGVEWDETLLPSTISGDHWAFQPITRPAVPEVEGKWGLNPIDAFVAVKHRQHGLAPAEAAARRTLIRRISLDLVGIPPSAADVESFVNDERPNAYELLVERMLASPHYGERWGRHWLDVARWAESEGYESNHPRAFAWRYRDYVIDSFNRDRPFDEFVWQQVAGDEIQPYSDENLIATGFLAAARISSNEEDKWLQRSAMLVDVVNDVGSALLGLTVSCAQCHNHKFDPLTIRDYYRLQGFFLPGQPVNARLRDPVLVAAYVAARPEEYEPAMRLKQAIFESARMRMIDDVKKRLSDEELAAIETPLDQRSVAEELLAREVNLKFQSTPGGIEGHISEDDRKLYQELKKKIEAIERESPPPPQTFAWYSPVTSPHAVERLPDLGFYPLPFDADTMASRKPYLQLRGDVHQIGPTVETGWPSRFDDVFRPSTPTEGTLTRLDLARWFTDPRHPLVARVWVNRIWHYHFGRGIVATPGDFGLKGAPPSHPELLDWLASELVASGWSTKHIHRLILLSATYRQSSAVARKEFLESDAENQYLWHWRPRRLEAEAIRDSILSVAGLLEPAVGGASVAADDYEQTHRRSLYLFQKRGDTPGMQSMFDGPSEVAESCPSRHTSTTALQSLFLLNNDFVLRAAESLAAEIAPAAGGERRKFIDLAFRRVLGRPAEEPDVAAALEFFERHGDDGSEAAVVHYCHAMLNLNEFLYIE